ncbi:hypothetical protein [Methanotorris formicicus]|uniref:Uncharacterized protein n=1 Tax=Methanotorris formicicus Mc-S-70 TaxID=647171 RepID=H1KWW3_9EURY|nr:hypothetical protein [Methanotorris formicicus]EHP89096.1 hypothetical protein MetfoDRAFT_0286 [Methanotorris formicicus Mc-S-70]
MHSFGIVEPFVLFIGLMLMGISAVKYKDILIKSVPSLLIEF